MRAVLTILTCIVYSFVQGQTNKIIDSLERVAQNQKDTQLIKTYNELTWQYRLVSQAKAIEYGNRAIALSQQYKFDKGLSQAYNDLGIIYYDRQDFETALSFYGKAMEIRKRNNDISGMAKLYNKIGVVHQRAGEFDKALENQLHALELFEKMNDDFGVSYSLNNIGILNQNLARYDEAIKYQQRSIALKEKIGDRIGLAGSYVNVANIYILLENFARAEEYLLKAEKISRDLNNKEYLSNTLNNLATLYIKTKKYKQGIPYATESFEIRKSLGDTKGMVSCLNNLGQLYFKLGDYAKAEESYLTALNMAKGVASCKPEIPSIYKNLSEVYEMSDKGKSLEMYKLYASGKDSLFTSDLNKRFAELEAKYESLEKEKQIALLNKDNSIKALEIKNQQLLIRQKLFELTQNKLALSEANLEITNNELEIQRQSEHILSQRLDSTEKAKDILDLNKKTQIQQLELANRQLQLTRRNVAIGFLVFILLSTGLLGYSFYRRKQLRQEARMQAAVLKQQELATKAVIEAEEGERQRIAKDLHDGVGQMMSAAKMNLSAYESRLQFKNEEEKENFDKIISLVDESCKEVRSVSHNMMPNALLKSNLGSAVREFLDKLDQQKLKVHLYTEGLEDRLDSNRETVLYRIIQECVNNVIKHSNATTLDISIVKDSKEITATIEDNGKGFDLSNKEKFNGIGLKNIRTRIEYLKGTVDFDSTPGKGTLVALHVPL